MCVKDSNYNWAVAWQNLSSVCPTKLDSNQFPQLQRLARKMKAVAQSNYLAYLVIYVSSNQKCERSILKVWRRKCHQWKNIFSIAQSENFFKETRMNNLIILHVHKERTDALDLKAITNELSARNERRCVFGKF